MQSVSSRIWTRIVVSNFYDDNHYTTGISSYDYNQAFTNEFDLMSRVFANGLGDQGLILGHVIPKTQKMVLDAALLYTQHYKLRIKSKVEQSKKWSTSLPYTSV